MKDLAATMKSDRVGEGSDTPTRSHGRSVSDLTSNEANANEAVPRIEARKQVERDRVESLTQRQGSGLDIKATHAKFAEAVQDIKDTNPQIELHVSGGGQDQTGRPKASISLIRSEFHGAGLASGVLKEVTDAADNNEVVLSLTPSPLGEGLSKTALINWYKRHGFVKNKDLAISDTMVRYPK